VSEITTFLSTWASAERARDVAFLEAKLTDDFVGVGPLGFQLPKAAWLARHAGDDLRYQTFDIDEVHVRTHGPVAIVTARQTAIGTFRGHPVPEVLRDTLLLSSESGRWQLAGIHMSFIAGTPGSPPGPAPPGPAAPATGPGSADQGDRR
jgi:ketosteroid isomerase-like protein